MQCSSTLNMTLKAALICCFDTWASASYFAQNLRTAAQSKDQSLSRGNQALVHSMEKGMPVRVIRGYKLDSPYAPEEGYRYDGECVTVSKFVYAF